MQNSAIPRSCAPRPVKYTRQISSTSARRSRSLRVLNMLTPRSRTDTWMDIRPVLEVISEDMTNGQDRLYSAWPVGHNDRCCDVKILDADCVQLSTNVVTSEYVMRSVRVVCHSFGHSVCWDYCKASFLQRLPLTSWWRKSSNVTVGQSSLIYLAHHCYD